MNKWLELIVGVALLVLVILLAWTSSAYSWTLFGKDLNFWHSAWTFLQGGIFWFAIAISVLLILLGINDLRE